MVLHAVPRRLDDQRRRQKISQFDIALKLGVSQGTISLLAKGQLPTHLRLLEEYARVVGVDVDAIRRELLKDLPALRAARHRLVFDLEEIAREIGNVESESESTTARVTA